MTALYFRVSVITRSCKVGHDLERVLKISRLLTRWVALALVFSASSSVWARDIVVHAGHMIDGVSGAPRNNVSILIQDERIERVEAGFVSPDGYEIVDLSDATVLPGLIDCHVHITLGIDDGPLLKQLVVNTGYDQVLNGANYARKTLYAGFTSVRDMGGYTPAVVALKKAITAGKVEGPRLWVAGGIIAPTSGHGDYSNGLDPALHKPEWDDNVVNGVEEAIKMVRQRHKDGADLIKISVSGGISSDGDDPNAQLFANEEIKAFVDTAHVLGMKVAAHAHGKGAIENASKLGVDSIEHGTFGDETTYKILKKHDVYLVPTLLAGEALKTVLANSNQLSPSATEKFRKFGLLVGKNVTNAYKAGVKIAYGTDTSISPHGENAREFALMVGAGISPMVAIQSATSVAAELLGAADDVGSIQAGRYADLVATKGDPLEDITELERVIFVMKSGKVVRIDD